nr:hypothetical protein [Tanacetum cinerariifolium]
MEEINNFQQDPDETLYKAWEQFKELLLRCSQHYLTDMQKVVSFYKGLDVHTRQILDSKGVIPSMKAADAKKAIRWLIILKNGIMECLLGVERATPRFYQRNNANLSYQDRRQIMEESLRKFMAEPAKIDEENSNLIKEIRDSTDAAIRSRSLDQGFGISNRKMSKVLQEKGSGNLPSSIEMNPRDHVKSISTTVEIDTTPIRRIRPSRYTISGPQNSNHLYDDLCDEDMGLYELKDSDSYSIRTTLLDDALPTKEKGSRSHDAPLRDHYDIVKEFERPHFQKQVFV